MLAVEAKQCGCKWMHLLLLCRLRIRRDEGTVHRRQSQVKRWSVVFPSSLLSFSVRATAPDGQPPYAAMNEELERSFQRLLMEAVRAAQNNDRRCHKAMRFCPQPLFSSSIRTDVCMIRDIGQGASTEPFLAKAIIGHDRQVLGLIVSFEATAHHHDASPCCGENPHASRSQWTTLRNIGYGLGALR